MTGEGIFLKRKIALEVVKKMIQSADEIESAIGHESTAQILTELTGINIPVNRVKYEQSCNEIAIIFQLRSRPNEGKILTREEIEETGYDFFLVKKFKSVNVGGNYFGLNEIDIDRPALTRITGLPGGMQSFLKGGCNVED
jgi:hypothetical protein